MSAPLNNGCAAAVPHRELQERSPRIARVTMVGRLVTDDGDHLCQVHNISETGVLVECPVELFPSEKVQVELRNGHVLSGEIIWSSLPRAGMAFDAPLDVEEILSPLFARTGGGRRGRLPRSPRFAAATIVLVRAGGGSRPALMQDISQSGAKLRSAGPLFVGQQITVLVPGLQPVRAVVRRSTDEDAGVDFIDQLPLDGLELWLEDAGLRF